MYINIVQMFLTVTRGLLNSYALSFNDYSYMYYLYIIIIWRRHRCNKAHFCLNFDLPYGYLHVTLLDPTLLYQLWQQGFNDTLTQFWRHFFWSYPVSSIVTTVIFYVPFGAHWSYSLHKIWYHIIIS